MKVDLFYVKGAILILCILMYGYSITGNPSQTSESFNEIKITEEKLDQKQYLAPIDTDTLDRVADANYTF